MAKELEGLHPLLAGKGDTENATDGTTLRLCPQASNQNHRVLLRRLCWHEARTG